MSGPLAGLRVLEFGNLVAAPYCGMLLADLGCDVIKVEPPEGDLARHIGPFIDGVSCFYGAVNRGKRSLAADPKHPDARHLLWELARSSDVVIHNLRRGAMERMGLDYEGLAERNRGLVYAVISAFGTTGPYADRSGIDLVFQGESGMMSIGGEPGGEPQKTATTIADFVAGTNAALLVAAALAARGATGRGRLVETSLRDGLIGVQAGWNALYFATGAQPPRTGTASPVTAPNQTFVTADGHLNLAIVSDRHFVKACELLDLEELLSDEHFSSNQGRVAHHNELASRIQEVLAVKPTDHWMELLGGAGLPVGRILTLPQVFSDPQVIHNQMVLSREGVTTQGSPLRSDGSVLMADRPPPALGEHTAAVAAELGVAGTRLERMVSERALLLG
jgi:crotonobetainyl-CoA:carnitine CoA-transferase CaiB-like acyl-CoA transferase